MHIVYEHAVIYLPDQITPLVERLNALSLEGWEFVAWMTGVLVSPTSPPSRMVLMHREKEV